MLNYILNRWQEISAESIKESLMENNYQTIHKNYKIKAAIDKSGYKAEIKE